MPTSAYKLVFPLFVRSFTLFMAKRCFYLDLLCNLLAFCSSIDSVWWFYVESIWQIVMPDICLMLSIDAADCWQSCEYLARETCLAICQKFDNFVTSKLKYLFRCTAAGWLPHQINCQSVSISLIWQLNCLSQKSHNCLAKAEIALCFPFDWFKIYALAELEHSHQAAYIKIKWGSRQSSWASRNQLWFINLTGLIPIKPLPPLPLRF